jgi:hypothetical protein
MARKGLIQLDAQLIENFAGAYLSPRYDQPHPVAPFHRETWGLYCDRSLDNIAVAAPRKHGKSSALTDAFLDAAMLWRWRRYTVFFSSSEDLAIEHLGRTIDTFKNNELIIRDFGIKDFIVDTQTDIVVLCSDGYTFRIRALGSGQKIRGLNWLGMRPDMLLGDDLESKENISTKETRAAFRRWWFREAMQLLGERGLARVHGTILHDDSLLWNLTHSPGSWTGRIFRAHTSYSNYSNILWPERFTVSELKKRQAEFVDAKDPGGYSCEYLNAPRDREDAYLKKEWFLPLEDHERDLFRMRAAGVDLAISQADSANHTVFIVGGKRVGGHCDVLSRRKGHMDAADIINTFFEIQALWSPQCFFVERGVIYEAIRPTLEAEMRERNIYLNIVLKTPVKDKAARGRPMQKRMRFGGLSFDKSMEGYDEYESVMLLFTAEAEALEDDDFDATAWLVIGLEEMPEVEPEDAVPDDPEGDEDLPPGLSQASHQDGRSPVTGY